MAEDDSEEEDSYYEVEKKDGEEDGSDGSDQEEDSDDDGEEEDSYYEVEKKDGEDDDSDGSYHEEDSDDDGEEDNSYCEVEKKDGEEDGSDGSDHEEDSDDNDVDVPLKIDRVVAAGASGVRGGPPLLRRPCAAPQGRFLGPARRFASAGKTAGFLGVAVVVRPPDRPATSSKEQGGGKDILVLYRYTGFEAERGGVEAYNNPNLHYLRFAVPPAGDVAGSLQWAGSSLAPLIYPARHRSDLQTLWSSLVSNVAVGIPPGTTRLKLIADVGILRRNDYTRRRMDQMGAALQGMIADPWPGYHVAMELRLPEPVPVRAQCAGADADADDGAESAHGERLAKRRKLVAEEVAEQECPAASSCWRATSPCGRGAHRPHVFHGACLKLTLTGSEMCPLCRHRLSG